MMEYCSMSPKSNQTSTKYKRNQVNYQELDFPGCWAIFFIETLHVSVSLEAPYQNKGYQQNRLHTLSGHFQRDEHYADVFASPVAVKEIDLASVVEYSTHDNI